MKQNAHACLSHLVVVTELHGSRLALYHWVHSCQYIQVADMRKIKREKRREREKEREKRTNGE